MFERKQYSDPDAFQEQHSDGYTLSQLASLYKQILNFPVCLQFFWQIIAEKRSSATQDLGLQNQTVRMVLTS